MKNLQSNVASVDNLSACKKMYFTRIMCPGGYKWQYKVGQLDGR